MSPLDIIYWTCLMLGGGYTLITLLTGSLSHAAGHLGHAGHSLHMPHGSHHVGIHGTSGHAGHVGHSSHVGHGGSDVAHHSHGSGDATEPIAEGARFNPLELLNIPAMSSFMLGFGGIGVVTRSLGFHVRLSLVYATAAGFGLWSLAWWIVKRLFGDAEGTSHNTWDDVIGLRAEVSAPIEGMKSGTVAYTVGGSRQTAKAISEEEELIPKGSIVRIRKIENHTVTVSRVE